MDRVDVAAAFEGSYRHPDLEGAERRPLLLQGQIPEQELETEAAAGKVQSVQDGGKQILCGMGHIRHKEKSAEIRCFFCIWTNFSPQIGFLPMYMLV